MNSIDEIIALLNIATDHDRAVAGLSQMAVDLANGKNPDPLTFDEVLQAISRFRNAEDDPDPE